MIRFNYEKIYLLARGDSELIVKYILAMSEGKYKSLSGASYLLNPEKLALCKESYVAKAEYIGLASYRDYNQYKIYRETGLLKSHLPAWIPTEAILNNPLLNVSQHNISFQFE